jgi:hypothetical protein
MEKQQVRMVAQAGFPMVLLISYPTPRIIQELRKVEKTSSRPDDNSLEPNEV